MKPAIAEVLDRAHAVEADGAWLEAIVRAMSEALGRGVVGNLVERRHGTLVSAHVALHGVSPEWRETLRRTAVRMRGPELQRRFTTGATAERGVLAVSASADDRVALLLDAMLDPPLENVTEDVAAVWRPVAERLASVLRLRSRLSHAPPALPPFPDDAEAAWHAFLEGRLALVDRFDRDGRRFVVVRQAAAGERDALTSRERQVLASVALGHANKRIALELGVSESTVSTALREAARKLGVRSRVELARMLGPPRDALTSRS